MIRVGDIDTVVMAFVDLQGRLTGKRATGRFFLDFATSGQVFYNGLYVATRSNASGSLGGGFSFASKEGFSARFEGSYDSVGVWGLDMWTAMMRLNWNF